MEAGKCKIYPGNRPGRGERDSVGEPRRVRSQLETVVWVFVDLLIY